MFFGGYKLNQEYIYIGKVRPLLEVNHESFTILPNGLVIIKEGNFWNGADMVKDTKRNLRASLVHDVYSKAMAIGILPMTHRSDSDKTYRDIVISDGMNKYWANTQYLFLRLYGLIRYRN